MPKERRAVLQQDFKHRRQVQMPSTQHADRGHETIPTLPFGSVGDNASLYIVKISPSTRSSSIGGWIVHVAGQP